MVKAVLIKNKKGVSLVYVILVLLVMSLLAVAVFTLFSSNYAQSKYQEQSVKAHFIAISGVELALGVLLYSDDDISSLLVSYFRPSDNSFIAEPLTDRIELENGYVDITISSYIESDEKQIRVEATGYLEGTSMSKNLVMTFNAKYPQIQKWE